MHSLHRRPKGDYEEQQAAQRPAALLAATAHCQYGSAGHVLTYISTGSSLIAIQTVGGRKSHRPERRASLARFRPPP